tara:strand:- start:102 stop:491 length:390 start_codon:yes stop_codon:yes gene_type:complete
MTIALTPYPSFGSKVTFIRQGPNQETETGAGIVLGVHLDALKRIMVHIQLDGKEEKINADINCINPTPEFIEKYNKTINLVKEISERGNKEIETIVSRFNAKVEDLLDGILGKPVDIMPVAVEKDEKAA